MKRIILSFALLLMAVVASAQSFSWGYCTDDVTDNVLNYSDAAILLPAPMMQAYEGARIKAIEVSLYVQASDVQACVWSDLNDGSAPIATSSVAKSIGTGWTRIEFNNPYVIDGKALYVGYTTASKYSVGTTDASIEGACFVRKLGGEWSDKSSTKGALTLRVVIEGDNLPADARMISIEPTQSAVGNPMYICGTFTCCAQPLTSYTVSYSLNDGPARSHTIIEPVAASSTHAFCFPVTSEGFSSGEVKVTAEVYATNGEPIAYRTADASRTNYINLFDYYYPKYMVAEEITGTWCGYCPLGIVGFAEMADCPRFIGIAVHGRDELTVDSYLNYILKWCSGYPNAIINRQGEQVKPRGSLLRSIYERYYEPSSAAASVKVKAQWTDDSETSVRLYVTSEFGVSESNATYALSFVTLENDINAVQSNYGTEVWKDKGSSVAVALDHVVRGVMGLKGIEGSIPKTVTSRVPIESVYDLSIPATVSRVKHIDIVALLLNTFDESIVNAYKIAYDDIYKAGEIIPEDTPIVIPEDPLTQAEEGISPVVTTVPEGNGNALRFSLDGKCHSDRSLSHGIYIERGKKYCK